MSSTEIPRTPTPQLESSAGPTVALSNSTNVEPPVAAAPAKKTRNRKAASSKDKKTKKGPACDDCRAKKIGCKHRQTIDLETGTIIVSEEPEQPAESEEPQTKRRRRTKRSPEGDHLIEIAPVPVAEPAEPAAQPGRRPSASRTRKRGRGETTDSTAGPSQPAQRSQRTSTLGRAVKTAWNDTTYDTFHRQLKKAKEDWRQLSDTIAVAHDQFTEVIDSMNGMGHILKEWDEKYPSSC